MSGTPNNTEDGAGAGAGSGTQLHPRRGRAAGASVTAVRLEVVDGPDRGARAVGGDALSIGTARDNALVVGDFTVSRYHLEVAARPGGILVTDLGSTNGTYVGAVRIERAVVPPGTLVTLGGTTLRIDDERAAEVGAAVGAGAAASVAASSAAGAGASGDVRRCGGMIGRSAQLARLFAEIERVAPAAASVLIVGESGTGKERVAEALHAASGQGRGPLVTIDCGALASSLLASELFGHERGAFTGADRQHAGAFERARGGTVFLDEIGELPPADQSALLGVLERRRFRRVGGAVELELGARVIAATNRDLRAEVNTNRFRHDLYHRLAVVVLRIPPLRERPEDIAPLVEHFARELGAPSPLGAWLGGDVLARWERHPWPGNVRELRNAVEAALVGVAPAPDEAAVAAAVPEPAPPPPPYKDARAQVVREFERGYLERLLAAARGNVSLAARIARMDRSHLIDLLRRHELKEIKER